MNTNEKELNASKLNEMKLNNIKPKAKRSYQFPLPMDEACDALMTYITATYGNEGHGASISVTKGEVVLTIEVG